MFELKIIKCVNRIYRGIIRLGLHSINARDRIALRNLDASLEHAEDTRNWARQLRKEADVIEDTAHADYALKQSQINSAYSVLSTAYKDLTSSI